MADTPGNPLGEARPVAAGDQRFVAPGPAHAWETEARQLKEAAMATVYLVTAGSGDTYRIERVYLDRDEAYGFAEAYNGTGPNEPGQVEE